MQILWNLFKMVLQCSYLILRHCGVREEHRVVLDVRSPEVEEVSNVIQGREEEANGVFRTHSLLNLAYLGLPRFACDIKLNLE